MGGRVAELITLDPLLELVGGIERLGHPSAGRTITVAGKNVRVSAGLGEDVPVAELLVDFTSPEGTMSALSFCTRRRIAMITGTTGQSENNINAMKDASKTIPLLFSPNMSLGITVLAHMLPHIVDSIGENCEIEVIEKHHRSKKDSPSGTAVRLFQAMSSSSRGGNRFNLRYGRSEGVSERQSDDVFVHSIRAGDIVGEHVVLFALRGERIEIKHVAESRDCFAHGTIAAIKYLLDKKAGWYSMEDVVNLPEP